MHLGLNEKQLSRNFQMGKVCGDNVDIVDGQPLGSVRISFGKNSTVQDILFFRQMLECCFISQNIGLDQPLTDFNRKSPSIGRLINLFIYPIKSCSAIPKKRWPICHCSGTLLHDRQLVIVNKSTGEWITQKRYPSICSIQIEMNSSKLILSDRHKLLGRSLQIPFMLEGNLENNRHNNGISCSNGNIGKLENFGGKEASIWLEQFDHSLENCELMGTMFSSNLESNTKKHQNRTNFSNRADFLLITINSAQFIAESLEMPLEQIIERFRPNFVVDFGPNWKPFQEERIKRFSIGSMKFKVVGQCQRCQMICIDQKNGEKNPNILIGLRNMRLGENRSLIFGVYLELERDDGFIGNRELQTGCNVHLL